MRAKDEPFQPDAGWRGFSYGHRAKQARRSGAARVFGTGGACSREEGQDKILPVLFFVEKTPAIQHISTSDPSQSIMVKLVKQCFHNLKAPQPQVNIISKNLTGLVRHRRKKVRHCLTIPEIPLKAITWNSKTKPPSFAERGFVATVYGESSRRPTASMSVF